MRRSTVGLVGGLAVVAAALVAPGAAAPVGAAPTATVLPSTGLLDRHPVHLEASGLAPGEDVVVLQCGGPDPADCAQIDAEVHILPPNVALERVDAEGEVDVVVAALRSFTAGSGAVDCTVAACSLRVLALDGDLATLVDVPLSFAATGTYQWPEATLEVTYPKALVDGGPLDVTGTGYHWWYQFSPTTGPIAPTEVCRAVDDPDPDADCVFGLNLEEGPGFRAQYAQVGYGEGTAMGRVTVDRHLDLPSGEWDCAAQGCTLALSQDRNPVSNRVALQWAPEWAPWPTAKAFVEEVDRRILGMPETMTSRVMSLTAALTSRELTGAEHLATVTQYPGYQLPPDLARRKDRAVAEVTRQYVAFLGRRPDTTGLAFWTQRLRQGRPVSWMADAFGATAEFRAQYQGLTDAQVVDRAYQRLLGRPGDPQGRGYWIGRLDGGTSRAQLVLLMARSAEFRAREDDHAVIEVMTYGLLGRAATAGEWALTKQEAARRLMASR